MATINMNQFKKGPVVGQIDLKAGGLDTVFTVRLDPDSSKTAGIVAGEGLKLVDGGANDANGVPLVDILSGDTDTPFGARVFDHKSGTILPGEICQVTYKGVVQFMEAAGALNRGVAVALKKANPGQVQAVGSNAQYGITLDKASQGDVIRVLVDTAAATT
jgi:hypothetical protein